MNSSDFDQRFDDGESVLAALELTQARCQSLERKPNNDDDTLWRVEQLDAVGVSADIQQKGEDPPHRCPSKTTIEGMRFVGCRTGKARPQWLYKTTCMAAHHCPTRFASLLSTPLALLVALPVGAMEALPGARTPVRVHEGWLAQKPPSAEGAIPAEVQGWFEGAKAAASRGEAAEALRLQRQVVAWLESHPDAPVVFRARALINLGLFLGNVGQRQEALAPTEEAVKITRELAKTNPAFLGDLAASLSNLGVRYTNLGRRQEALAPTEEAVKIRRELAKTNPAFLGDLAASLSNLGVSYSDLGRRQEALAQDEEAVKIYRELAKTNPAFLGDLATSLSNLGVSYSDLGRRQEALAPTEEAVKIRRELAKTNPAFLG
ncbi:MAG: tetratricopeptide repeat protein, partial [Cyanobacteriota bacterium]|nr:tetratricopeptide repeat protein [Cyanobacteriota bacterium]